MRRTPERRQNQIVFTYELKIQNLSKEKTERLNRLFAEAKWFWNHLVEDPDRAYQKETYRLTKVSVKTPDGTEKRELQFLCGQSKQALMGRVVHAHTALKALRAKGHKTGKLKFKSEVNSIPFPQYNNSYYLVRERNRIHVAKIGKLRVLGMRQIPDDVEFANAYLIRKPSGFYLRVVCFRPKTTVHAEAAKVRKYSYVGIDFGLKNQLTLSNGKRFSWYFPETKRLKKLQRALARKVRRSRNWFKTLRQLRREYEYIRNCRRDALNKVLAYLKRFAVIAFQKDNLKGWHQSKFGSKKVQNTALGGITSRLKRLATLGAVVYEVKRFTTTTNRCSNCLRRLPRKLRLTLSERQFECPFCGHREDRDVNAAQCILRLRAVVGEPVPA